MFFGRTRGPRAPQHRLLSGALLALAVGFAWTPTACAGQVTLNSTPYSTLMSPGTYAIVNGLEFSNFQFFNPTSGGSGQPPDPTEIFVSPGSINANSGLYFATPQMNVLTTGFMDFHISFDVTALDPSADLTAAELKFNASTTGNGLSRIVENVGDISNNQLGQLTAVESQSLPGGGQYYDSTTFAAQNMLQIDKDVEVTFLGTPGAINSASIGNFTQAFALQGTAVPEPSSLVLAALGVGLLGCYGWRRRSPALGRRRHAMA